MLVELKVGEVGQHLGHTPSPDPEPLGDRRPHALPGSRGDDASTADTLLAAVSQVVRIGAKDLATTYRPAEHEVISCPSVISATAIGGDGASELGGRYDRHIFPTPLCLHLRHEGGQRRVNLLEVGLEGATHVRVSVCASPTRQASGRRLVCCNRGVGIYGLPNPPIRT